MTISQEQTKSTTRPSSQLLALLRRRLPQIGQWLGLALLGLGTIGWWLAFPVLPILGDSLHWQAPLTSSEARQAVVSGPVAFFRNYPQIIWLSLVVGAGLLWLARPLPFPTVQVQEEAAPAGRGWQKWLNPAWRGLGIGALAAILVLAAILRIGNARDIGATDLISLDYDESVHATAALLLTHGATPYKDFFLTHSPIGPLLWSIPLRLGGAPWGGLTDLLRLRLFTSLLSLGTVALVYLTGRRLGGRWAGSLAGSLAAFVLTLDLMAVRTDQQMMLEPLINFFSAAALCAFVHYRGLGWRWPLLAGLLAGVALAIKVPALAVVVGLALTLLVWRRWRGLLVYAGGVILAYLVLNGPYLLATGPLFLKQVFFYQFLRPVNRLAVTDEFNSNTTLTAFGYIAASPGVALTVLAAGLGLAAIGLRWAVRREGGQWLPVLLTMCATAWLYTGKAGFFPHYYAHMAMPLALLAGGIVNFWWPVVLQKRAWTVLAGIAALVVVVVLTPAALHTQDDPSQPVWSWERAAARTLDKDGPQAAQATLATLDPRFSFVIGSPLPRDSYNRYIVDNAGYTEYLALGLEGQSLSELLRKTLFDNNLNRQDLRQARYSPLIQSNLLTTFQNSEYVLVEDGAKSQMTGETAQQLQRDFLQEATSTRFDLYRNSNSLIGQKSGLLWGDAMRLVGFTSPANFAKSAKSGEIRLPLTLYWLGEKKISQNYVIFIHLLNAKGDTVAQRDTAPRYGQLNTTIWPVGELLDDDQSLPLPANLPAGHYQIQMGIYNPVSGERLKLTAVPPNSAVPVGADSLILQEVDITN